jgi:hypothetical protein
MTDGHDPAWPDKALFAAILLILAGAVGAAFQLARPLIEVDQDRMPSIFTDEIPYYTLALSGLVLLSGVLSLRYQAALPAYVGAVLGVASLGVFGLVPALSVLAVAMLVKSHLEGEETRLDGHELHPSQWPDKAMASSLLLVVVGGIAATQGLLILAGDFDPLVLGNSTVAGVAGLAVGLLALVAARQVYHLRTPWLGWLAFAGGLATLGFYLLGPVLALVGMLMLGLAHREHEFLVHGDEAPASPGRPVSRAKARRRAAGRRATRPG